MASLTFKLIGLDESASDALKRVAKQATKTARKLAEVGAGLDQVARDVTARVRVAVTPSDALDGLRRDLDRVAQEVAARVRVQVAPGALDELRQDLDRAAQEVTARVRVVVTPVGALAELRADLDRAAQEVTASVRVAVTPPDALADLRRDLDRIGRTAEVGVRVDVEPPGILEEIRRDLDRIAGPVRVRVRVEVTPADALDELRRDLERATGMPSLVRVLIRVAGQDALEDLRAVLDRIRGDIIVARIRVDIDSIEAVRQFREELDRIERDIRVRVRVDGAGRVGELDGGLRNLAGTLAGLPGRLAGAAGGFARVAVSAGALATTALTIGPALAPAVQAIGAVVQASISAAPALLAFGVAGKVVSYTLKEIFAEGRAMREALKPLADGLKLAGDNASKAAAEGIRPLVEQFNHAVWPEINHTMTRIGTSVNRVATEFLNWAKSTEGMATINAILHPIWQSVERLEPSVTKLAISFANMLGRIMDVSLQAGTSGLSKVFEKLAEKMDKVDAESVSGGLRKLGEAARAVREALSTVGGWIDKAVEWFKKYKTEIFLVADALALVAIAVGGPVVAIIAAVGIIVRHFDDIKTAWTKVRAFFAEGESGDIFAKLKTAAEDALPKVKQALIDFRDQALPVIEEWATKFRDDVIPALEKIGARIRDDVIPAFTGFLEAARPVAAWFMDELVPFVERAFERIGPIITGALDAITGLFKIFKGVIEGDWSGLWDGLTQFVSGWFEVVKGVVQGGIDTLVTVWSTLASAVWEGIQQGWDMLLEGIGTLVERFIGKVKEVLGIASPSTVFVAIGSDIVAGLLQGLTTAWATITGWLTSAPQAIINAFAAGGTWLLNAGQQIVAGLWQGLQTGWMMITTWLGTAGTTIINAFAAAGTWLLAAGAAVIQGLWTGITTGWATVSAWLGTVGTLIINAFAAGGTWLLAAGQAIMTGLWTGITTGWQVVSSWFITTTTVTIPGFFAGAASWLVASGRSIIQGLLDGIQAVWGTANGWLSQIKGFIGNHFAGAGGWLLQAGKNIVQGLIDGMKSMLGAVGSVAGSVAGKVKGFFQFSPAKEGPLRGRGNTFYSGQSTVRMLADGMISQLSYLEGALGTVAGRLASPMSFNASLSGSGLGGQYGASLSAGYSGGLSASGSVVFNITVQGSVATTRGIAEELEPYLRNARTTRFTSSNARRS